MREAPDSEAGSVEVAQRGYRLRVLPASGARVVHLSGPSGVNWLATAGSEMPSCTPTRWADGDTQGWDECFPNVAPESDDTRTLPDHGDLWNIAWVADAEQPLALRARCRSLPLTFSRTITVGRSIVVDYSVENSAESAVDVCWAMHLLLDVDLEQLAIPQSARVRVEGLLGVDRPAPNDWSTWRAARALLPLDQNEAWGSKLFVAPGEVDRIEIARPTESLMITPKNCPVAPAFGIWVNRGVLPGRPEVRHVGVEASFGDHDRLTDSIRSGTSLRIPGLGSRSWSVELTIRSLLTHSNNKA